MFDYEDVKALARATGCRVSDMLVLADGNDPFYAGQPARRQRGEWFAEVWQRFGFRHGAHLRRVHYVLVSQREPLRWPDGVPYENTDNSWKRLVAASLSARYLRLIPDGVLVDRRNPEPIVIANFGGDPRPGVWTSPAVYSGFEIPDHPPLPHLFLGGFQRDQDFLVEVWVEKSTMNDVLVPLANRLKCNLVTGLGEMSEIAASRAVDRAIRAGKPLRILYVSDFDPGGRSMPVALARKIEFRIRNLEIEADIQLTPIALLPEQCLLYTLPRTPIKETERRAERFEARFGAGATELDALEALHPGTLAEIVEQHVIRYIDPTLARRVDAAENEIEERLWDIRREVCARYADPIAKLSAAYDDLADQAAEIQSELADVWEQMRGDLAAEAPAVQPEDIPRPRAPNPVENPIFDSRRGYLEQLDHYHAWQGRGLDEEGD